MNDVEEDTLEWEVRRHREMALILSDNLVKKIDECEELKSEVARLRNIIEIGEMKRHEKDS